MNMIIRFFKISAYLTTIIPGAVLLHGCGASMSKLTRAAASGDMVAMEAAIKGGAKVDELDDFGQSALYRAVNTNNIEIVKYLLDHGANPDLCTRGLRRCPIVLAALNGNTGMASLLVEAGADIN
jgi:ankyrin repeat protein